MREIKISEILNLLDKGYTRDMIKEYYSLTNKEIKNLFTHPKLRGLKAKKANSFQIVDDTEEMPEAVVVQEVSGSRFEYGVDESSEVGLPEVSEPTVIDTATNSSWGEEDTNTTQEETMTEQPEILFNN